MENDISNRHQIQLDEELRIVLRNVAIHESHHVYGVLYTKHVMVICYFIA